MKKISTNREEYNLMTILTNNDTGEEYEILSSTSSGLKIVEIVHGKPKFSKSDVWRAIEAYLSEGTIAVESNYYCSNGWAGKILRWYLDQPEAGNED